MCLLLSVREVLDDVPTSSAHAIHDFRGFPEQNGYKSLTRLCESLARVRLLAREDGSAFAKYWVCGLKKIAIHSWISFSDHYSLAEGDCQRVM